MAVLIGTVQAAPELPAAALRLDGSTPAERLVGQLSEIGVPVTVMTRPAHRRIMSELCGSVAALEIRDSIDPAEDLDQLAETLLGAGEGPVVLVSAEVVVHSALLGIMLAGPSSGVTLLTDHLGRRRTADLAWPMRAPTTVVTAAASDYHVVSDADAVSLGMMRVAADQREAVACVARHAATSLRTGELEPLGTETRSRPAQADALALLVVALVRAGVRVHAVPVRGFAWGRPTDAVTAEQAARRLSEIDEQRARVDAAVKPDDGFFGTFFVSPYSKHLARGAAELGISPNAVTVLSMVFGVLAAALFALGNRPALVAGALVLHVAFTLDCVDGQLARYTGAFSALGAYLDAVFDRAKEFLVYAGLAMGASTQGDDVWTIAAVALILQTAHHTLQFSWPGGDEPSVRPRTGSFLEPEVGGPPAGGRATAAGPDRGGSGARRLIDALTSRTAHRPALYWIKRMVPFPIGERFAVITVTAALGGPRLVFSVFIAWVSLAMAWSTAGRVLRSVSR